MRVLLVKMSSFGDVLHTLPALEDCYSQTKIQFDWAVEPSFSQMANLSQAVSKTIDVPLRDMRKHKWSAIKSGQLMGTIKALRQERYDMIIDAQGLIKSASISTIARGQRLGLNKKSIREPLASAFYHKKIDVPKTIHAVERTRMLLAKIFNYDHNPLPLNYGIDKSKLPSQDVPPRSLLFLHGTTWDTKHWPEHYWHQLAQTATQHGYTILLPWGNLDEKSRAQRIKASVQHPARAIVLDKMSLLALAGVMLKVEAAVAVDTGLGHLASALDVPCVSLYGSTDPKRTGTHGNHQYHLSANKSCAPCLKRSCQLKGTFAVSPPCFEEVPPQRVWTKLQEIAAPQWEALA